MHKVIVIGNPGCGKSTLLSSLVEGSAVFNSGISIGKGKTKEIQIVEYNGTSYIDTPGLSDVKLRAIAASEIEKAFKIGGEYKVALILLMTIINIIGLLRDNFGIWKG